ncbi:BAG family molecular chaperone regulator 5 isoform X4 [Oncorhynchus mykiss]|uniref:BAG family molecular chaperone regulator 5 n=3 Tax=Salmoninae TaxID=504568 RepID=A0A8C7SBF7_ONCMY|nr:BAG family molecular chaperone regulator 5 isoform X4 [Oncorhynchus mykiss]XP_021429907.1 BAG family molecular chaperone regulator 5 isoform X4 [Oncorhynchus mykiss]XP_021429909.1 BAG family molecular chaperone regulator 5 isoform X4 [Oncorhynchus mykiss]XP_021429910.1 BAG family molecular chaperone regulator 5 isoform X4 [Oncorhynchus mykiss]XP_036810673.1 BAG family molecular chaperone regulator 5 isoform X4 [Oncorhynchus mykiss]XP_036810674.1 BAG family molecular chaperone regulator 5 is
MDHGSQQQQQQHPAMIRLYEVQREVQSLGPQVCTFSGLKNEREYRRLERELTRLLLEVDQVDTEGRADLQGARKRAAQEVEGLLRYLEENATHPSRLAIEELSREAQGLVEQGVVEPQRAGGTAEISDELVDAVQELILRLTQVKTGGRVPLRKARYRALTRLCAVQDVIEGRTRQQTLPLSEDTHVAVQRINQVMVQVSGARSQLVALLMGLSGRDSCAHLSRVLTELLVELDALDVSGNAAVRNYRKQVVEEINGLLKHLDLEGEGDDTRRYDLAQNDSIRQIEAVRGRVGQLRGEVLRHCGVGDLFRPKPELQSLLTHLDQVDTARNPCIREARRRAVLEVQAVITFLDLREALICRQPGSNEPPQHRAVWMVLGSLSDLQAQVLCFNGKRADKSYILLEELLTKQLLALDAVDPQGDEMTKVARKQAVKFAQNILSYLDMKTDEWEY